MMKRLFFLVLSLGMFLLAASPCLASKRVALVIGNAGYRHTVSLDNPKNDVRAVSSALGRLGFKVEKLEDVGKSTLESRLADFRGQSRGAELALLYYAGHAVQIEGRNYLVPVDAEVRELGDVSLRLVTLNAALQQMNGVVNVVILDACRDNPFADELERSASRQGRTLGATRGLVREESTLSGGTYLIMAAAPEKKALDGPRGGNSPYTGALLKYLETPGLELRFLHAHVRETVEKSTNGFQTPEAIDRLPPRPIYLASSGAVIVDPAPPGAVKTTLKVEGRARGARVLVDGREVGLLPTGDMEVSSGRHRVRVEKDGFEPYERFVDVEGGRAVSVFVDLSPVRPLKARLYVDPEPSDARVRILNIVPVFQQGVELDAGSYDVEITAEGHETKRMDVVLSAGEDKRISIRLEPVTEKGFTNSVGMGFVWIPAGEFMMGSGISAAEVARRYGGEEGWYKDEHPQHRVILTRGFYLQTTEVTVGQWRLFVRETGYRSDAERGDGAYVFTGSKWEQKKGSYWDKPGFSQGEDHPVTCVSWNDAVAFIEWLNGKEGKGRYRLPTEAEWEYAARAGSTTRFCFGDDEGHLGEYAWYGRKFGDCTHPVGKKKENGWGLYDMHGNVWEWCSDWWGDYPSGTVTDPTGPSSGSNRVFRGGCWGILPGCCRSAYRFWVGPGHSRINLGFRLASVQQ
jgi:formylglycine-generating enzyme required for sulfatase activity